jgi:hypothetical protein
MLIAFDGPVPFSTVGRRHTSNVPSQALTMLNDPFVREQSQQWAGALLARTELRHKERIELMFLSALARRPVDAERAMVHDFLGRHATVHQTRDPSSQHAAWSDLCHALFNVKEFMFVP